MEKTATIYVRARGMGSAIGEQQRICREAATRLGATVTQEYVEHGQQKGRPTQERMMRGLAGDRPTDLLVIPSYDTLTRSREEWTRIRLRLERAEVQLVSADCVDAGGSLSMTLCIQQMQELTWRYATAQKRTSATTIDQKEHA